MPVVAAAPAITRVTASGIKRQGEVVWLEIEDDGTANAWKFDVQVGGTSLTSLTINDATATSRTLLTGSERNPVCRSTALVGVDYVITGYASSNGGNVERGGCRA
jgi:hypothetical protein